MVTEEYAQWTYDKTVGKDEWQSLSADDKMGQMLECEKSIETGLRLADALRLLITPGSPWSALIFTGDNDG